MSRRTPIGVYKTYMFRDKDPAIDLLRTALKDNEMSYKDVEVAGGPKAATLYNWFHGETRRPMHSAMKAAWRAIPGHDYGPIYPKSRRRPG